MFPTLCMHVEQAWGLLNERLDCHDIKNTSIFFQGRLKISLLQKVPFSAMVIDSPLYGAQLVSSFPLSTFLIISYFVLEPFHWGMRQRASGEPICTLPELHAAVSVLRQTLEELAPSLGSYPPTTLPFISQVQIRAK